MGSTVGGALALLVLAVVVAVAPSPARDPAATAEPSPGRALRAAVDAMQRGDDEDAEVLLRALARDHPVIADYADWLRLRLLVQSGRTEEAIALAAVWPHEDSPLRADVYTDLGRAYAALGREEDARSAWQIARRSATDESRLAALQMAIAESLRRSGDLRAAGEGFVYVWSHYPLSPEEEGASRALDEIEPALGEVLRTPHQARRRGDAFFRARRNEAALRSYDHALATRRLSASDASRARRKRAETLFRLRRYSEAASAFAALPQDDEVRVYHARSVVRSGDVLGGAALLAKIGRRSRSQGARATLLAGILYDDEGETAHARELYLRVTRMGSSAHASSALWSLGWAAYREGKDEDALGYFEQLESRGADALSRLRARYWRARTAERAGRPDAAQRFTELAREFPFSYYGWRARSRAGTDAGERAAPAVEPGVSVLPPRALARPRILLEAGMRSEALEELNRLFVRARGLEDRLALAQMYEEAGNYSRPQRLMLDPYREALARGPDPRWIEMWWYAWPAPWAEEVEQATGGAGAEPALVWAVMREESGYRPAVVSVSGARGLLQLMPETAERLARELSLGPVSADDLFRPLVNIRLGSHYLANLLRRFHGRASAAIGSYNAGPEAVARWTEGSTLEDDEWVEAIPYDQTRQYVKRVLASLHVYRVLH